MHLLDHTGTEISTAAFADDMKRKHFPNGKLRGIAAASDMDNTMFENDLGTLVFLEKLSDTSFWDFDIDEFGTILLPKKYRELLKKGASNQIADLQPHFCQLVLDLSRDIVNLYIKIRSKIRLNRNPDGEQKLVEEFARKMIEMDRVFMIVDSVIAKQLNGEILMRTRFFAGKNPIAITKMTKRVMNRQRTSIGRNIGLGIHEENIQLAGQRITESHINEVHGKESPYKQIDRAVKTVDTIRDIIWTAINELRIPTVVATGNLKSIAKTAVHESDYKFMENQRYVRQKDSPLIVGTWLRSGENGTLHPRIEGEPVLGMRKAMEAMRFANDRRKTLGLALGDSPSTDGPMIESTLIQSGVAVIVGKDIDTIRKRFETVIPLNSPHLERVYYTVEKR